MGIKWIWTVGGKPTRPLDALRECNGKRNKTLPDPRQYFTPLWVNEAHASTTEIELLLPPQAIGGDLGWYYVVIISPKAPPKRFMHPRRDCSSIKRLVIRYRKVSTVYRLKVALPRRSKGLIDSSKSAWIKPSSITTRLDKKNPIGHHGNAVPALIPF